MLLRTVRNASLEGLSPCLSLDYALAGLDDNTTIQVLYSHMFSNATWTNVTRPIEYVAIVGVNLPTIQCTNLGLGIAFWGKTNVTISGISWEGCSIWTPTTYLYKGHTIYAYRALFFYNVTNLVIENCQFMFQG